MRNGWPREDRTKHELGLSGQRKSLDGKLYKAKKPGATPAQGEGQNGR